MKLAQAALALLLALCLVFPTAFQELKAGMLITLIGLSIVIEKNRYIFHPVALISALAFSMIGLAWSIYGVYMGNPGAVRVLTVMAIYPLIFTFLTPYYKGNTTSLKQLFLFCALLIVTLDLAYVSSEIFFPANPITLFFKSIYADSAVVDNAEHYLKFTLPNVATCIFLLPFIAAQLLFEKVRPTPLIAFAGLVLVALISGRRAIFVTAIAGPLLAYMMTIGSNQRVKISLTTASAFIAVTVITGFIFLNTWPDYVISTIGSIFNFTENESNIERKLQFDALWAGFLASPILGSGAGAVADYIRSDEMPWAYELFYISILFQYGILGTSIYFVGTLIIIVFLTKQVRTKGRRSFEFYYLAGLLSFIMASATNPYIAKFDYMWTIFIPIALLNHHLLSEKANVLRRGQDA